MSKWLLDHTLEPPARGLVPFAPWLACERARKAIGGKRVRRLPILLALVLLLTSLGGPTLAPAACRPWR